MRFGRAARGQLASSHIEVLSYIPHSFCRQLQLQFARARAALSSGFVARALRSLAHAYGMGSASLGEAPRSLFARGCLSALLRGEV